VILHPSQNKIASSRARFRVVNAGRRFGKTVLSSEEIKGFALFKSKARIVYIAPTYQQARDILWDMLKKELLPITKKVNESRLEIEVMDKQGESSFIFLRGWESVETLRGQSFDFMVLDEIASMRNFWTGWNEVLSPTLIDRKGSALFISTPKGFNHFYDLYNMQEKDTSYESFHFTTYDNPNIPVDEIEREKLSKPENTFAQEYLADFRKQEGLVYKEFRRDIHLWNETTERQPRNIVAKIAGVDFGFTNPTAVLTILKDFDGSFWVEREWYKRGKTDTQIAEYVAVCGFNEVYPDPEAPSAIQQMENLSVNVKEVVKNKDSIKNGINKIRALFLQNKLHIHVSCQNLISELETYSYPEKREGHNEEENPIKENDHALDALRYAIGMDEPINYTFKVRQENRIHQNRINRHSGE
jgi:PBSX family phage terminase large subunit